MLIMEVTGGTAVLTDADTNQAIHMITIDQLRVGDHVTPDVTVESVTLTGTSTVAIILSAGERYNLPGRMYVTVTPDVWAQNV